MDKFVLLFNEANPTERERIFLRMMETFKDSTKISLLIKMYKLYAPLQIKKKNGDKMPLTQQLLLLYNNSDSKYITGPGIKTIINTDAKLLNNLITVCNYWNVNYFKGNNRWCSDKKLIFSDEPLTVSDDSKHGYEITKTYKITDVVSFFTDLKKENMTFDGKIKLVIGGVTHMISNYKCELEFLTRCSEEERLLVI